MFRKLCVENDWENLYYYIRKDRKDVYIQVSDLDNKKVHIKWTDGKDEWVRVHIRKNYTSVGDHGNVYPVAQLIPEFNASLHYKKVKIKLTEVRIDIDDILDSITYQRMEY